MTFGYINWEITKGVMLVAQGKKEGTLYVTTNSKDNIDVVATSNNAYLWHCRLGYISQKRMKELCSKGKKHN